MTQGRVSESTSGSSKLGNTLLITGGLPKNTGSDPVVLGSGRKSYTYDKLFEAGAVTAP